MEPFPIQPIFDNPEEKLQRADSAEKFDTIVMFNGKVDKKGHAILNTA
jgi:hypothetical protein